jgi:hypothetical protein
MQTLGWDRGSGLALVTTGVREPGSTWWLAPTWLANGRNGLEMFPDDTAAES